MKDKINHPPHYTHGTIETIEVIEDWNMGYHLANVIKYISRYRFKYTDKAKQINDLEKAIWFLERKIKKMREDNG